MPRRSRNSSCRVGAPARVEPFEVIAALAEARGQHPADIIDRLGNVEAQAVLKERAELEPTRPTWPAVQATLALVPTYEDVPEPRDATPSAVLRGILSTRVHVYTRAVVDETAVFFVGVLTFEDELPSARWLLPFCACRADEWAIFYTGRTLERIASTRIYRKRHQRAVMFPIYGIELTAKARERVVGRRP